MDANQAATNSAVVGTTLDAAAGAEFSSSSGAAIGTGLLAGSAYGVGASQYSGYNVQQHYDYSYQIIPAAHAKNVPSGATVRVFDDAGHMSQMEKANEVNALLKEHVAASDA